MWKGRDELAEVEGKRTYFNSSRSAFSSREKKRCLAQKVNVEEGKLREKGNGEKVVKRDLRKRSERDTARRGKKGRNLGRGSSWQGRKKRTGVKRTPESCREEQS